MDDQREVTERDFRKPEFRDAKPEDYEFREDGSLVKKDRWEQGIRNLAGHIGWARKGFEVEDVVNRIKELIPVCGHGVVGCKGGKNCTSSHK